jgi:hypothetical protein
MRVGRVGFLGYLPHCLKAREGFQIEIETNDMRVYRKVKGSFEKPSARQAYVQCCDWGNYKWH